MLSLGLTRRTLPVSDVVGANGLKQSYAAFEEWFYDTSGRMIGSRDANGYDAQGAAIAGHVSARLLRAGSGLDDAERAQVVEDYRAGAGAVTRTGYDVFGDARQRYNGLNLLTEQSFDHMGRLVQVLRPQRSATSTGYRSTDASRLSETWTYDGLGQRLTHRMSDVLSASGSAFNTAFGANAAETTDYDLQGRVICCRRAKS
jgi:YD repeat-containing protein